MMFHAKRQASFLDSEVRDLRNKFARFDNDGSGERCGGNMLGRWKGRCHTNPKMSCKRLEAARESKK